MKVVLDTNVLLISISPNSKYRWIYDLFLRERIGLCVSLEILLEYEEVIGRHMSEKIAASIIQIVKNAPNTEIVTRYFEWKLINTDPDDNKFIDCAIAGSANCIVTEDNHFSIVKKIDFPKVEILNIKEFKKISSALSDK